MWTSFMEAPYLIVKLAYLHLYQTLCSSVEEVAFIVPPDAIYLREREILPTSRYHRTIFVWVADSSISDVIRILDDSILWCEQVGIRASYVLNLGQTLPAAKRQA